MDQALVPSRYEDLRRVYGASLGVYSTSISEISTEV